MYPGDDQSRIGVGVAKLETKATAERRKVNAPLTPPFYPLQLSALLLNPQSRFESHTASRP